MRDNISPEEKLLKLIKGEKKSPIVSEKKVTPDIPIAKPQLKNLLQSLIQRYITSANIRKLLPVVLGASIVYLFISFIYPWIGLKKIKLPEVSQEKIKEPELKLKEEAKPFEFYSQGMSQRQIFTPPTVSRGFETGVPTGAAPADLVKDINLVGILAGENPQAVIEDKKTQKTYYVTKGQFVGEFQVEDIQEGKIILNYQGQRYELYL